MPTLLEAWRASPYALRGDLWYALLGVPLHVGSVTLASVFFDRLMSALQLRGSAVVLIQFIDTVAYLGTILLLVALERSGHQGRMLPLAQSFFEFIGNKVSSSFCSF